MTHPQRPAHALWVTCWLVADATIPRVPILVVCFFAQCSFMEGSILTRLKGWGDGSTA